MRRGVESAADGLRLACEMEARGYALYSRAAALVSSPQTKRLLEGLALDERGHFISFKRDYDRLTAQGGGQSDDQRGALLKAMAAEMVFPAGLMGLAKGGAIEDPRAILAEGIEAEEDSIAFYLEMATECPDAETAAIFRRIAEQEGEHLAQLRADLEAY